jgi:tripeptidyl-peptidase II
VDIVNYSYGEDVAFSESGCVPFLLTNSTVRRCRKITEAIEHLVFEKGVIFVSSAGNNGPALSTNGAPGSTCSASIGIAAYLCPQMSEPMYGTLESVDATNYPWSSKGPAPDGYLGVSVSAPGAAVTGVPRYSLKGSTLMNGTSMSSPNAAGTIACLLSAMKAQSIPVSPLRVRLALENSAVMPTECRQSEADAPILSYGTGMIQVESAYELLVKHAAAFPPTALASVVPRVEETVKDSSCVRGIYLREKYQCLQPREFNIFVNPRFPRKSDPTEKVDFQRQLALTTYPSTATAHIKHPSVFELRNEAKKFQLRVDPTQLERGPCGSIHYSEVRAYDTRCREIGPIFRLPISVVVPLELGAGDNWTVERELATEPGNPHRLFITAPAEAAWACLEMKSLETEFVSKYVVHLQQLLPDTQFSEPKCQTCKAVSLEPGGEQQIFFRVIPNRTLECCVAKEWSNANRPGKIRLKLEFHGSRPMNSESIEFVGCLIELDTVRGKLTRLLGFRTLRSRLIVSTL